MDEIIEPHTLGWRRYSALISQGQALCTLVQKAPVCQGREGIRRVVKTMAAQGLSHELTPMRWFNDLDDSIFKGQLRRGVCLERASLDGDAQAGYVNPGVTISAPGKLRRITVLLADDAPRMMLGRERLIGTLVHETLHAWFRVWCGHEHDVVVAPGMDHSHGYYFYTGQKYIEGGCPLSLLAKKQGYSWVAATC